MLRSTRNWLARNLFFFFQAEDGIRDKLVLEFRRVLFRSDRKSTRLNSSPARNIGVPLDSISRQQKFLTCLFRNFITSALTPASPSRSPQFQLSGEL